MWMNIWELLTVAKINLLSDGIILVVLSWMEKSMSLLGFDDKNSFYTNASTHEHAWFVTFNLSLHHSN